jgi:ABC-2 type transport system ATP-binding protein
VGVASDLVIETTGLRKEFHTRRGRRVVAVDSLDLAVPAGGVHGFLGPNGSGKTTTIRMLLGLARPSRGEMQVLGEPIPGRLPQVMEQVGAVVEQPRFSPSFSGRKNLLLLARAGGVPSAAVDAALEQVGLQSRDRERYKAYSLGMKQRLAIAATLLRSPRLLILDEPTNGLDPAGIRDIRTTVRSLGDTGVTVLLSSHILAEVQQVCHSVSIIGNGRLLASGPVDRLVGASSVREYTVGVADPGAAADVLKRARYRVRRDGSRLIVETPGGDAEAGAAITRTLADQQIFLRELMPVQADLESVFLQLTREASLPARSNGGGKHAAPAPEPELSEESS